MEPAHSWTYSAYNMTAIARFTAAVAAEVRRQEDTFDETAETLRVQKEMLDIDFAEKLKKRYPPDSQLYREDVNNYLADSEKLLSEDLARLKETYPLGHEGVDPEGALGTYRLRASLLRHVERLEAKRRAAAVAAGDGTSSSFSAAANGSLPNWTSLRPSPAAKAEDNSVVGARSHSTEISSPPAATAVAAPQVKREAVDEDGTEAPAHQTPPRLTASSVADSAATSVAPPTLTQVKAEGSGSPSSAFPPSWTSLKAEAAKRVATDGDNGAYFTPHPTVPGAPFPRYTSAPSASMLPQQPSFVASLPVSSTASAAAASESGRKLLCSSSVVNTQTSTQRRHSPSPCSQAPHHMFSPSSSSSAEQSRRGTSARRDGAGTTTSAQALSHAGAAEDEVMQLWRRLWSGQPPPDAKTVAGASKATPALMLRPTAVMVKAVAAVAQTRFERERARCIARQARVEEMLDQLHVTSNSKTQASGPDVGARDGAPSRAERSTGCANATCKRKRQKTEIRRADRRMEEEREFAGDTRVEALKTTSGASATAVDEGKQLRTLQGQLTEELTQLDDVHSKRIHLVQQLLNAIERIPSPARRQQQQPSYNINDEVDLLCEPSAAAAAESTASQQRTRRRAPQRRKQRQSRNASPDTTPQPTETAENFSSDPHVVAEQRRELLHQALLRPHLLISKLKDTCEAEMLQNATRPDGGVSSSSIETISLPSNADDLHAEDLEAYMWPAHLEARIQHELRGYVHRSAYAQLSSHLALSQAEVRELEERYAAAAPASAGSSAGFLSLVPRDLDGHVVSLPSSATHGWLYVQGRGEAIVAHVKLL